MLIFLSFNVQLIPAIEKHELSVAKHHAVLGIVNILCRLPEGCNLSLEDLGMNPTDHQFLSRFILFLGEEYLSLPSAASVIYSVFDHPRRDKGENLLGIAEGGGKEAALPHLLYVLSEAISDALIRDQKISSKETPSLADQLLSLCKENNFWLPITVGFQLRMVRQNFNLASWLIELGMLVKIFIEFFETRPTNPEFHLTKSASDNPGGRETCPVVESAGAPGGFNAKGYLRPAHAHPNPEAID